MASGYELSKRNERPAFHGKSGDLKGEHFHGLSVKVLFTTVSGTLDAVRRAARMAYQLNAHVEILMAYVVPYPLPIDQPQVDPDFRLRQLRQLCEHESIETWIDVRLCRDAWQCIHDALGPCSLILIGGRESRWHTASKRLAAKLRNAGHQVLFVSHDQRS